MADPPILVPPKMVKSEDLHHHALEQLPNLAYCINDNPRWGEAIILGFQHYFTMLGTTVLIPSLVILNINGHSQIRGTGHIPATLDDDEERSIPFLNGANLSSCPPWSSDENV
ncbi:unnamed protein product [Sphagnum balticum]